MKIIAGWLVSLTFIVVDSTHMDIFYQTFGFSAAVCAGIILAVLFTALNYFKRARRGLHWLLRTAGLLSKSS